MPRVCWASDLHLDHAGPASLDRLTAELRSQSADICLLTGDISVASQLVATLETLADAAGCPLYFVLGNHDHYGGSVARVRDAVIALAARRPQVQWLPPAGVIALHGETALVGVDGWADGRIGDPLTTPLRMNDDRLIAELAAQPGRRGRIAVKCALADADATRLATLVERATEAARTVVIATHVPPFVEALPGSGRLAHPDWQPLLVCGATGAVLRRIAAARPEHRFLVLCGHTHSAADVHVAPNLRCIVAGARYGAPQLRMVEV